MERFALHAVFPPMDLAIRQQLLRMLELAQQQNARIGITRAGGKLCLLQTDLICHETHVEGTDQDGSPLTIPYSEIETVSVSR